MQTLYAEFFSEMCHEACLPWEEINGLVSFFLMTEDRTFSETYSDVEIQVYHIMFSRSHSFYGIIGKGFSL